MIEGIEYRQFASIFIDLFCPLLPTSESKHRVYDPVDMNRKLRKAVQP